MRCLGLFIEGKSVKIAIVSKVKNQLTLERIGEFDEVPQELLQEKNLHVVTGLSAEDVVRREVTLKLARHAAVLKALPFQLESLLPFSLEETIVHPFFYPHKDKTDVVAFATTRLALKKHLIFMHEKQVDPDQISCVPAALARLAKLLFPEQPLVSWVYKHTAIALEGEKIVFAQSLSDESRLETFLKNKYGHHFPIPAETPSFQNYSSDQLRAFAIPIGLALDGLYQTPCQFRQKDFTSSKMMKRNRLFNIGAWAACLSLTVFAGSIGGWMLYRKEIALKDRIAVHFSSSGPLEEQLLGWQKQLSQDGKEFPLLPDVPPVKDLLAWLGTLQEPIEIVQLRYSLVQYPKAGEKQQPYNVKVDLEFTAPSPAVAHRFQEALEKAPTLVDKKQKVAWTAQQNSYKLSFVLRKI
jgi:hypothetical protein